MPSSEFGINWPSQWPKGLTAQAEHAAIRWAAEWELETLEVMPGSTCSMVFSCIYKGRRAVLKVPVVGEEVDSGFRALLAFQCHGGVPIWRHDESDRVVLMPRLLEASGLNTIKESEARQIWVDLVTRLHKAPPFRGTPLGSWYKGCRPTHFPEDLWVAAKELLITLAEQLQPNQSLHGDLHHFNILPDEEGTWFAIDPKGVQGDPAWECAAFMRNPQGTLPAELSALRRLCKDRVCFFENCSLGFHRINDWAFIDAVFDGNELLARALWT